MKLVINNIKLPVDHSTEDIRKQCAKRLHTGTDSIKNIEIKHKSIDARSKPDIRFIYSVWADVDNGEALLRNKNLKDVARAEMGGYVIPKAEYKGRPVIIGAGPAGLFCALLCVEAGLKPIVIERGAPVDERARIVSDFWEKGILDTECNVSFGEGGAGTFSDGKLNTVVKDRNYRCSYVMKTFVRFGAPENILYDAKPHVGTDILMGVVKNIREYITQNGGEVLFHTRMTHILKTGGRVAAVAVEGPRGSEEIRADRVVLAIGHSARDTFEELDRDSIYLSPKPFAVGFRIEHPRRFIDNAQYGCCDNELLPTASYKLTAQTSGSRGVYSFCMCPGGYVVNASSEKERIAVNGMSYSGRHGNNSNSALIITVGPEDFGEGGNLAGMVFQRKLEHRAWELGNSNIPVQSYGDFYRAVTGNVRDNSLNDIYDEFYDNFAPAIKGRYTEADLHSLLPKELNGCFIEAMSKFGHSIRGYEDNRAFLAGIESRTSSPVRIWRNEDGCSPSLEGLYPCGEGAGYAGGITSAAMDGVYIAETIIGS